jgi:hypothetical protein
MNCKDFESALNDVARAALMDAGERERAETHAAGCQPCAARMSDAHALTAGLRALSSQMAQAEAPARIEANLLAAFRAQVASAPIVAAAPDAPELASRYTDERANVAPLTVKKWSWPKTFGAAGLAAAAAFILVLLVPFAFHKTSNSPATNDGDRQLAALPEVKNDSPNEIETPSSKIEKSNIEDEASVKVQPPRRIGSTPRATKSALTTYANYDGVRGVINNNARGRAADLAAAVNARPEVVTDFIPLAHGGGFAAGEGAHVVRVEVPRTALARFGLPVNAENSDERVKADVLLGEDGIARAIRFVR